MLNTNNLACGYADKIILENISLAVARGEFVGVIGPNGSGKTTLFRAISGVLPPRNGEVRIAGRSLASYQRKDLAKILAVVPQNTTVSFSFLVEDVVMMGRMPYLGGVRWETPRDVRIAKEMMALTDVKHLAERYINELSGGETQRVMIARALTQEPQMILLDEPTAFLDINHQVEIYDLLKKLNVEDNLTIMTISHDLNLASLYCDRLIMLKNGKIYMIGTPNEVLTEKTLEEVYETEVMIEPHPITDRPRIILKSQYFQDAADFLPLKIHLVGGGGSIANLMRKLIIMGHQVTCGVLNSGDSDCETAKSLGVEVVTEKPFSPISEYNYNRNLKSISQSDVVIMGRVAFGTGNKLNLLAVSEALGMGKQVYLLKAQQDYDFLEGEATMLRQKIIKNGAVELANAAELFSALEELSLKDVS